MEQISASDFNNLLQKDEKVKILDVREAIEFHTYNIGGKNLPLSQLSEQTAIAVCNKTDEIIVICKAGIRSQTAQAILLQYGYKNVKNLSGGLLALQRLSQKMILNNE